MRRGERRKGWRKFWKNDDKKMDEMDRKECRKMMKTNKGRRWKMKKSVGWGVCMKAIYCWAWPSTTKSRVMGPVFVPATKDALNQRITPRSPTGRLIRGRQRQAGAERSGFAKIGSRLAEMEALQMGSGTDSFRSCSVPKGTPTDSWGEGT